MLIIILTFNVPQYEMSVAGGFRSKCEIEAMARLRFISVHHADGVNKLEEKKEQTRGLMKMQKDA